MAPCCFVPVPYALGISVYVHSDSFHAQIIKFSSANSSPGVGKQIGERSEKISLDPPPADLLPTESVFEKPSAVMSSAWFRLKGIERNRNYS
jgi:hypothetical protein